MIQNREHDSKIDFPYKAVPKNREQNSHESECSFTISCYWKEQNHPSVTFLVFFFFSMLFNPWEASNWKLTKQIACPHPAQNRYNFIMPGLSKLVWPPGLYLCTAGLYLCKRLHRKIQKEKESEQTSALAELIMKPQPREVPTYPGSFWTVWSCGQWCWIWLG